MEKYSDEKFGQFVKAVENAKQRVNLGQSNMNFPKMTKSERESLRSFLDALAQISQDDKLTKNEKIARLRDAIHSSSIKEEEEEEEK